MDNNLSEKKTLGRRKIQMKKIEKKSSLQVSFSKRRTGLFKKASEISVLCGAKIAILVQSPAKKVFTFGNPSVDSVLSRFETGAVNNVHSEMENNFCWDREVEGMELYKLEEYFEELEGLRGNILKRIEEIEKQKLMADAAAAWCIGSSSTNHDYQESEFTYLPDLMLQEQDFYGGAGNVEALVPNVNSSLSASSNYFMVTPAEDHDHLSLDSYVQLQDPSFFDGIDHHLEVWNL